jgi:hypothetical protein
MSFCACVHAVACTRCGSGDAIMARPAAALPHRAWLKLVNACEALPGGPPMYSLVARVKEIVLSGEQACVVCGGSPAPRDGSTDTGYVRGCSPNELILGREDE